MRAQRQSKAAPAEKLEEWDVGLGSPRSPLNVEASWMKGYWEFAQI